MFQLSSLEHLNPPTVYFNTSFKLLPVDLNLFLSVRTDPSSRHSLGLPKIQSPAPRDITHRPYSGVRSWGWTQSTEENSNINYSTSQDTFIIGKAKRLHSDCRSVKGLPCTVSQLSWMLYDTLLQQLEL